MSQDRETRFYFVGDFIDRGPASKQVLDYLFELDKKQLIFGAVRGNHEQMFLDTYENKQPVLGTIWHANNALSTIKSFFNLISIDGKVNELIPVNYFRWINALPFYIALEDYLIVHAGINFDSKLPFNDHESMLWIREEAYDNQVCNGKIIIHGHTPIELKQLKESLSDKQRKVINIDTGCVYKEYLGMGFLSAINLDNLELIYEKNMD
jgi:serine/threonine protein phosphatase 1